MNDYYERESTYIMNIALMKDCAKELANWSVWNGDCISDEMYDLATLIEKIEEKHKRLAKEAAK